MKIIKLINTRLWVVKMCIFALSKPGISKTVKK